MLTLLKGVKVLDLSRLLPGPLGTQFLADLGADVLKVEEYNGGDYARWMVPVGKVDGGNYLGINRNKRSLKLDLRQEAGKEILRKLIARADILVEQFRPGVLTKLGFPYNVLQEINPRLIICSVTGYGQDGPDSLKAGHDLNYLGQIGFLDLVGEQGGPPALQGSQIADIGGSIWTALSILAALYDREKTGRSRAIDLSMTDTAFTFMSALVGCYDLEGRPPVRGAELLSGGYAWYGVYKTQDCRYLALGMYEMKFWQKFCYAVNRPDYIELHDNFSAQGRLRRELAALIVEKSVDEWLAIFDPLDVCISKVNNLQEALEDPQLNARGMIVNYEHPVEGTRRAVAFPVKFSGESSSMELPPPGFGEHTDEVLALLGFSDMEIAALHQARVV